LLCFKSVIAVGVGQGVDLDRGLGGNFSRQTEKVPAVFTGAVGDAADDSLVVGKS
jgi:hypothetical protein